MIKLGVRHLPGAVLAQAVDVVVGGKGKRRVGGKLLRAGVHKGYRHQTEQRRRQQRNSVSEASKGDLSLRVHSGVDVAIGQPRVGVRGARGVERRRGRQQTLHLGVQDLGTKADLW